MNLGIPDCLVGISKRFVLVELKVAKTSGKVELSPHQIAFHTSHQDYPTFVLVQSGRGKASKVQLYRGQSVMELSRLGVMIPAYRETTYPFDWKIIEEGLTAV